MMYEEAVFLVSNHHFSFDLAFPSHYIHGTILIQLNWFGSKEERASHNPS